MNNNNQLPTLTTEITEHFSMEVIDVMKNSLAPTATPQEFLLFAHKAASYGLDPFKNEIFFIKYGNTARIQFAAEAYLSKAREKEGFQPPDTQMVHENDEFKITMNNETKQLEVTQHEIGFPRGKIIGAYSIAYRDDYKPVTVVMDIAEVAHMFTGQNKANWNQWTSDMFGKHVQQRALKRQYGLNFDDETISKDGDGVPKYQPNERKDITPQQEVIEQSKPVEADPRDVLKKDVYSKLRKLGITTKGKAKTYMDDNAPGLDLEKASESELIGFIELLNVNLDMLEAQQSDDDVLE